MTVSLTKAYAGADWLAERERAQERRDENDYFQRGVRLMWGKPVQAWHPGREDLSDDDIVDGDWSQPWEDSDAFADADEAVR